MKQEEIEVLRRSMELSRTGLEAMEHLHHTIIEGKLEQTATLFKDVFQAYVEIEQATRAVLPQIEGDELKGLSANLQEAFKLMLAAYEGEEGVRPLEVMESTLLPRYKSWQEELETVFIKYTCS